MTDARTPAAAPCPDCRALVPATMEDRAAHRDWHNDLKAKHRGVQKRIAELAELTTRAVDAAAGAKRAVESIEIPEPVEPMRIETWPEDEIDDPDDEDDAGLYAGEPDEDPTPSTYAADDVNATVALDPADYPLSIDRPGESPMSGLYTPRNIM